MPPTHEQSISRRQFVQTGLAAAATVAVGVNPLFAAKPVVTSPLRAPFTKPRLSLAAYSMRQFMQRNWPTPSKSDTPAEMSIDDFVDYCATLEIDGCELTSYYFPAEVTNDYLARLKLRAIEHQLEISGTAIGNDFCLPEGEARDKQLALTRLWIDYAAKMGAPVIRIFAGRIPQGDSLEVAIDRCAAGINESVAYAAKRGIALALENHGGITATPEEMLRIVEKVNPSPYFGVNFDSGNFRTDDPYRDLAKIAPYAINAQIKVAIARDGGKKEEADIPRTVKILRDSGYSGWIVLEYEEEDPKENIPRYIEELRKLIAS